MRAVHDRRLGMTWRRRRSELSKDTSYRPILKIFRQFRGRHRAPRGRERCTEDTTKSPPCLSPNYPLSEELYTA